MFPTLAAADVKVKEEKIKAAEVKTEKYVLDYIRNFLKCVHF